MLFRHGTRVARGARMSSWSFCLSLSLGMALLSGCGGRASESTAGDPRSPEAACAFAPAPARFREIASQVTRPSLGACGHVAFVRDGAVFVTSPALEEPVQVATGSDLEFSATGRFLLVPGQERATVRNLETGETRSVALSRSVASPMSRFAGMGAAEVALSCDDRGARFVRLATGVETTVDQAPCHASFGSPARAAFVVGTGQTRVLAYADPQTGAASRIPLDPIVAQEAREAVFAWPNGDILYSLAHEVSRGDFSQIESATSRFFDASGREIGLREGLVLQLGASRRDGPTLAVLRKYNEPAGPSYVLANSQLLGPFDGTAQTVFLRGDSLNVVTKSGSKIAIIDPRAGQASTLTERGWSFLTSDTSEAAVFVEQDGADQSGKVTYLRGLETRGLGNLAVGEFMQAVGGVGIVAAGSGQGASRLMTFDGKTLLSSDTAITITSVGDRDLVITTAERQSIASLVSSDGRVTELMRSAEPLRALHQRGLSLVQAYPGTSTQSATHLFAGAIP